MSTFQGRMPEFPDIRVDFFRLIEGVRPPLACFLSHVHSDHLIGLESLKAPFVYCSAATKQILLRLERYPHRINFEKGVLEARKQHYKHLKKLLKPIPLETPTRIQLSPGNDILVTLFDANHCTGAVMFLIEGIGKAVLYTGDTRAEPWFLNALTRNPHLIEYTAGLRTLDCIYLDTSYTADIAFPTKAEGLTELLQEIAKYPPETKFHFAAWTFGYEEVWMALSRALNSPIHVDKYKLGLYESLRVDRNSADKPFETYASLEVPSLAGYKVANTEQPSILTLDSNVKLHSCEKGTKCSHLDDNTVWIRPIITRTASRQEICEIGVGGGAGDLIRYPELELESEVVVQQLMVLFNDLAWKDTFILAQVKRSLMGGLFSGQKTIQLDEIEPECESGDISLENLRDFLVSSVVRKTAKKGVTITPEGVLPKVITFPYSRHSSYPEQRNLVKVFRPLDVYPCTVDEANWHDGVSMRTRFGDICSADPFRHDHEMYILMHKLGQADTQQSFNTSNEYNTQERSVASDYDSSSDNQINNISHLQATATKIRRTEESLGVQAGRSMTELARSGLVQHRGSGERGTEASNTSETMAPESDIREVSPEPGWWPRRRKAFLQLCRSRSIKRARLELERSGSSSDYASENSLSMDRLDQDDTPYSIPEATPGVSYYDADDDVHRCLVCGWEVWRLDGGCVECSRGFESVEEKAYHGNNSSSDDLEECINGRYLDGMSAYDTDSVIENDKYEINSFIDDSPIEDVANNEEEDSPGAERDYEQLYHTLLRTHTRLESEFNSIMVDNQEFRHIFIGSEQDESDNSQLGMIDTDITDKDSSVSEIALSEVERECRVPIISRRRLRSSVDRVVLADDDSWNNVSLILTDNDHTALEREL